MDCPVMCVWSLEWSQPVSLQHLILKWSVAYKSKRGSKEDDDTLLLYSIFRPLGVAADLLFASQVELSWVLKRPHKRKPAAGVVWVFLNTDSELKWFVLQIFQLSWTFSAFSGWSFPCALLLQLWIQSMSKEHFSICSKPTTTPKVFPSCQPARRTHYSSP